MISLYSHPTASPLMDCIAKFSCTFFFFCWKLFCTILFPALYLYYRFAHIYHYLLFFFWLKKKNDMLDCQKIRKLRSFPKEEKISTWTKISQRTNLLLLPRNSSFEKKKRKRFWGKCKLSLMSQPIDSNLIWPLEPKESFEDNHLV